MTKGQGKGHGKQTTGPVNTDYAVPAGFAGASSEAAPPPESDYPQEAEPTTEPEKARGKSADAPGHNKGEDGKPPKPAKPVRKAQLRAGTRTPDGLVLQRDGQVEFEDREDENGPFRVVTGPADLRPALILGMKF